MVVDLGHDPVAVYGMEQDRRGIVEAPVFRFAPLHVQLRPLADGDIRKRRNHGVGCGLESVHHERALDGTFVVFDLIRRPGCSGGGRLTIALRHFGGFQEWKCLFDRLADETAVVNAEDFFRGRIGAYKNQPAVGLEVVHVHADRKRLDDAAHPVFRCADLLFDLPARVDVRDHPDQPEVVALRVLVTPTREMAPELGAVPAPVEAFQIHGGNLARQQGQHLPTAGLTLCRVNMVDVFAPEEFLHRTAEHFGHAPVGMKNPARLIHQKDRHARRVHDLPQHSVAFGDFLLVPFARGDVPQDHEGVVLTFLLIRRDIDLHVEFGAIRPQALRLVGRRHRFAQSTVEDVPLDPVATSGRDEVQHRFACEAGARGETEEFEIGRVHDHMNTGL